MGDGTTVQGLVRLRRGEGAPLVLLPGLAADATGWLPAVPGLAARYDVVLLDLPGFGAAAPLPRGVVPTSRALAQAVAAELQRLDIVLPHVAGYSLGGRVGLELARTGAARSVVAIAPNGTGTPPEQAYLVGLLLAKRVTARTLLPLLDLPGGAHLARLFLATEHARPWRLDADHARQLVRSFARSPGYLPTLAATALDAATGLDEVRCPVLLLQGTHDAVALGQPPRFLPLLPGARLRVVPGAGHVVVTDAPEVLTEQVLQFLGEVDLRTAGAAAPERPAGVGVSGPAPEQPG